MNKDLYPTPKKLIAKLLEGIKLKEIGSILEPGGGNADICDYIKSKTEEEYSYFKVDLDVIEIDENCQHIIKGKGYRLIHDDFLTFQTFKTYDLIVANFPFSVGDQHLQKALFLLSKTGGELRCLVNAETIKNPYSNLRFSILRELQRLNASIEYLQDEFIDAERSTSVEVAFIKVTIEKPEGVSVILDELKKSTVIRRGSIEPQALVDIDYRKAKIAQFNIEAELGVNLIDEYNKLKPFIMDRFNKPGEETDYSKPIIKLLIEGDRHSDYSEGKINNYLRGLRHKYWEVLINDPQFRKSYTQNILSELSAKLMELRDYDFNLFNIIELERELQSKIQSGIEDSILKLFNTFTRKYAYDEQLHEGNVHYYNGWKTNKAHRVNKKIIIPLHGHNAYSTGLDYRAKDELQDMVKVFNYLSDDHIDVPRLCGSVAYSLDRSNDLTGIDYRYFTISLYKKGTCHIKFTDQRLLDKFNIFGSQRKGWLPPAYGKISYDDMVPEEKAVVDSFQGKEEYAKVFDNPGFYLTDTSQLLLTSSVD